VSTPLTRVQPTALHPDAVQTAHCIQLGSCRAFQARISAQDLARRGLQWDRWRAICSAPAVERVSLTDSTSSPNVRVDMPTVPMSPLRPIFCGRTSGYGDIGYIEFPALPITIPCRPRVVNRRFSPQLHIRRGPGRVEGMDLTEPPSNDYVNPFLDYRMRNYGKCGVRPQTHNRRRSISRRPAEVEPVFGTHGFSRGRIRPLGGDRTPAPFISGRRWGLPYSLHARATDVTGTSGVGRRGQPA